MHRPGKLSSSKLHRGCLQFKGPAHFQDSSKSGLSKFACKNIGKIFAAGHDLWYFVKFCAKQVARIERFDPEKNTGLPMFAKHLHSINVYEIYENWFEVNRKVYS